MTTMSAPLAPPFDAGLAADAPRARAYTVRIETERAGFALSDDGRLATVIEIPDGDGIVIDRCAWLAGDPGRWWLQRRVGVILGEPELELAAFTSGELALCATPAAWLRSRAAFAACVVDWGGFDPVLQFAGLARVRCDSAALATRLEAIVAQRLRPGFEIVVPGGAPGTGRLA